MNAFIMLLHDLCANTNYILTLSSQPLISYVRYVVKKTLNDINFALKPI